MMHHQFKSTILRSAHTVFMCFAFISAQTVAFAPYDVKEIATLVVKLL